MNEKDLQSNTTVSFSEPELALVKLNFKSINILTKTVLLGLDGGKLQPGDVKDFMCSIQEELSVLDNTISCLRNRRKVSEENSGNIIYLDEDVVEHRILPLPGRVKVEVRIANKKDGLGLCTKSLLIECGHDAYLADFDKKVNELLHLSMDEVNNAN